MSSSAVSTEQVYATNQSSSQVPAAEKPVNGETKPESSTDQKKPFKPTTGKPNPLRESFIAKLQKIEYEIQNINGKIGDINTSIEAISLGLPSAGKGGASGEKGRNVFDEFKEKKALLHSLNESRKKATQMLNQMQDENERNLKQISERKASEHAISELERRLESGNLKIVEERKIVTEISKLRKGLGQDSSLVQEIEALEKSMQAIRLAREADTAKINQVKLELDQLQPNLKESETQRQNRKEQLDQLYDERTKLKAKRETSFEEKRAVQEEMRKALDEQRAMRERHKQRDVIYAKKREVVEQIEKLEEKITNLDLSAAQEAEGCDGLIVILKAMFNESSSQNGTSTTEERKKGSERTIEPSNDLVPMERPKEELFVVKGKGKQQGKGAKKSAAESGSFKLPINVIVGLGAAGVPIPVSAADIPAVIVKLESKRDELTSKSEEKQAAVDKQKAEVRTEIDALRAQIKEMEAEIAKIKA